MTISPQMFQKIYFEQIKSNSIKSKKPSIEEILKDAGIEVTK